jgi:hypothetical protein
LRRKASRVASRLIPPQSATSMPSVQVIVAQFLSPGLHSDLDGIVKSAKETRHGLLQRQLDVEILLAELVSDAYYLGK